MYTILQTTFITLLTLGFTNLSGYEYANQQNNAATEQRRLDSLREEQLSQQKQLENRQQEQEIMNRHLEQNRLEQRRLDNARQERKYDHEVAARDRSGIRESQERDDRDLMDDTIDQRFLDNQQQMQNYNGFYNQSAAAQSPNQTNTSQGCDQNCNRNLNCQDYHAISKMEAEQREHEEWHKNRKEVVERWWYDHLRD